MTSAIPGYSRVTTFPIDEAIIHQSDATYDYYAFAPPGTLAGTAVWKAMRFVTATQTKTYADGNANYDNVATTLSALTYS